MPINLSHKTGENHMNDSFTIFVPSMNLLKTYRLNVLRRRASAIKRTVRMCNAGNIQKVGILWLEGDSKAYSYLHDQFRSQKVIVRNLCFTKNKEADNNSMITVKDLNWLGFPRGGNIDTFIQTDFDILLNTTVESNFAMDVITALSAASFKIGWDHEKLGFFDLSIDVSKNPDALYLAEQQIFYLKQLNKNIDL
jgi:hypothetical protein